MDKFDLKKYLTEGKILKENTTKYEPFVEGETFLKRSEYSTERADDIYIFENEEEYNFVLNKGADEFLNTFYPGESVFDDRETFQDTERVEYSVGNDFDGFNLTPVQENKSTTQLKENTSEFPEFKEGDVWELKKKEYWNKIEYYGTDDPNTMTKEQYNFLIKNGVDEYFEKYGDEWEIIDYSEKEADKEEIILVSNNGDEFNIE